MVQSIFVLVFLNLNVMKAHEEILISKLFAEYDPLIRPLVNHKLALNVSVSIEMTQGIEILEREQILVTSLLIEQVNIIEFMKIKIIIIIVIIIIVQL